MFLFRDSLPNIKGYVRCVHAIPYAPSVDIYFDDKKVFSDLSFGNVTNYIEIAPKTYSVKLYKSGTHENPIIEESIQVTPNSMSTINITFENNEIAFFTLDDSNANSNPLLSYVRFINLSPTAPLLSLRVPNGIVLFNEASYLKTNNYYPTSPGIYNFIVSASDGKFNKYISNIHLTKNLAITIYMIGLYDEKPPLGYVLLKDGIDDSKEL